MKETFLSAILAGICIAIGGTVFLKVGGVAGAILFSFGLVTVVSYKLKLYTGTAGFVDRKTFWSLIPILLGNILGCFLTALAVKQASPDLLEPVRNIVESRLAKGSFNCLLLAIGCGFIMTTAVNFARQNQWLPLLFGVPVFILCGFTHSIADAFYFLLDGNFTGSLLFLYLCEVLGNFIGCNLYRGTFFFLSRN